MKSEHNTLKEGDIHFVYVVVLGRGFTYKFIPNLQKVMDVKTETRDVKGSV